MKFKSERLLRCEQVVIKQKTSLIIKEEVKRSKFVFVKITEGKLKDKIFITYNGNIEYVTIGTQNIPFIFADNLLSEIELDENEYV